MQIFIGFSRAFSMKALFLIARVVQADLNLNYTAHAALRSGYPKSFTICPVTKISRLNFTNGNDY